MARRELGPATWSVVQAVGAALEPSDTRLVVACSGGPDSLALAYAVAHLARRHALPYAGVVVDHGLQHGSAAVADRVRVQLGDLGYPQVRVVRVAVTGGGGLEAAARTARHAALEEAARPDGTVLLGHTLDDQAETVLLGLARGSGARSLAGMAPRSRHLVRPLLGLRHATTVQACTELGLPAWTDPHNTDHRFTRVRVRETLLPVLETELGPGVAESLARTADLARDDADLLDALAADADPGTDHLRTDLLANLPRALRTRLIRRWLLRHGVPDLHRSHVLQVEALVTHWRGQGPVHLPGRAVGRSEDSLRFVG